MAFQRCLHRADTRARRVSVDKATNAEAAQPRNDRYSECSEDTVDSEIVLSKEQQAAIRLDA